MQTFELVDMTTYRIWNCDHTAPRPQTQTYRSRGSALVLTLFLSFSRFLRHQLRLGTTSSTYISTEQVPFKNDLIPGLTSAIEASAPVAVETRVALFASSYDSPHSAGPAPSYIAHPTSTCSHEALQQDDFGAAPPLNVRFGSTAKRATSHLECSRRSIS